MQIGQAANAGPSCKFLIYSQQFVHFSLYDKLTGDTDTSGLTLPLL